MATVDIKKVFLFSSDFNLNKGAINLFD